MFNTNWKRKFKPECQYHTKLSTLFYLRKSSMLCLNRISLLALTRITSNFYNAGVFAVGEVDTNAVFSNSLSFYCSIICEHVSAIDMYSAQCLEPNLV